MIASAKKRKVNIPRAKIARAVELALPKGRKFALHVQDSELGGMKIIRVVTPAWKQLRPAERIIKVREAVERKLSHEEQDRILRFSVLTPGEYKKIFGVPHQRGIAKYATAAAKRKAAHAPARRMKSAVTR